MTTAHDHPNQFALLAQRRFAPFFWVQFLGAGNDNLFKFAFTVMVTYQINVAWLQPAMAGLVIGALFILPFLLFSATSGQLADKYDKKVLDHLMGRLESLRYRVPSYGRSRAEFYDGRSAIHNDEYGSMDEESLANDDFFRGEREIDSVSTPAITSATTAAITASA